MAMNFYSAILLVCMGAVSACSEKPSPYHQEVASQEGASAAADVVEKIIIELLRKEEYSRDNYNIEVQESECCYWVLFVGKLHIEERDGTYYTHIMDQGVYVELDKRTLEVLSVTRFQ